MNPDFTLNLHDLESLLTKSSCSCHFINPNKTRILLWREVKDNQTTYHLRIGIQKFLAQEQIDRNGEIYWRFGSYEVKKEEVSQEEEIPTPTELDPITKFHQRQAQATNHDGTTNSEPAVNSSAN